MRRPILFILTALVALFAAGGAAQAATPFSAGAAVAGTHGNPDVAVGPDGTGHAVWVTDGANAQVGYCRVAPGAAECDRTDALDFTGAVAARSSGRAAVFAPAVNEVVIVAACNQCPGGDPGDKTFLWRSVDNGSTFGPPTQIGTSFAANGAGTWLDGEDIFVGANAGAVKAMKGPSPGTAGSGVPYSTSGLFTSDPQVVLMPGTSFLVVASNDGGVVKFGVYPGGVLDTAAINSSIYWTEDQFLSTPEPSNKGTSLNAGPNGVYLSYLSAAVGNTRIGLRHFTQLPPSFGAPVYLESSEPADASGLSEPDSYQDADGRIHVVWRSLYDGGRLRYRVSDTTGGNFGSVGNIAVGETFTDPQVAAAPGGTGFAVWKGSGSAVRVVALDPQPEPSGPGGPSDPGGPGGPAGPAPAVTRATIGDRTLRPGQGTTFTFISSKAGRAVLTIEKKFKGLKVKRKVKVKGGKRKVRRVCVPRTKKRLRALRRKAKSARAYRRALRRQSCRGFRRVGRINQAVRAGRNTIRFNGRVAGRRLGRGVYRAKLIITDSAGQRSRAEVLRFRVVGKQKKARGKRGAGRR